jgi:hypothetical protein
MENKKIDVRLNKIPIKLLVEALMGLYDDGVDYVDILGINNEDQDTIGLIVKKEYLSKIEEEEEKPSLSNKNSIENTFNIKLSDEDLNQLL